ncbi:MAG TPA: circadian clock KaiB family protein [Planctomycetota bacterium]|nr:circadian clock KaiB family protein [Planctomycetota bacterium]
MRARRRSSKLRIVAGTAATERDRPWRLKLYIAGLRPESHRALASVQALRAELGARLELTVVDVYQHPNLAREHDIIALPTLVVESPLPVRTYIGNLSNVSRVLLALGIRNSINGP